MRVLKSIIRLFILLQSVPKTQSAHKRDLELVSGGDFWCTISLAGAVPGAPGDRRAPRGAENWPKPQGRIYNFILPKVCRRFGPGGSLEDLEVTTLRASQPRRLMLPFGPILWLRAPNVVGWPFQRANKYVFVQPARTPRTPKMRRKWGPRTPQISSKCARKSLIFEAGVGDRLATHTVSRAKR